MPYFKRASLLAALLGVTLPSHADLITNGSFELGSFVPNAEDTMTLAVGATDMTGWTVENAALAWIGPANPFGLSASQGSYFLDLSGYHDNAPYGGVLQSQTIATTIGSQYRLTFDIGSDLRYNDSAVGIQVTAGSATGLFSTTPLLNNQWESFIFDFVATAENTTLSLVGQSGSGSQKYIGLDNVSLVIVPEPGTLTLLAVPGLLFFGAWRRLRRA